MIYASCCTNARASASGVSVSSWLCSSAARLPAQVYFENPRHALVYSSWGRLAYTNHPTPEGSPW
jgi:hypothetical protein